MSAVILPLRRDTPLVASMTGVHVLRGALSSTVCDTLCRSSGARQHHSDDDPIGIRKSQRLPAVAANILGKIDAALIDPHRPLNVDEMMCLYRLGAGEGGVAQHVDQDFAGPGGSVARFSVLVYLNDSYDGGETLFRGFALSDTPSVGDAYLFRHDIPHEGLPVRRGVKFVLKTDLFVES